jgi:hypothetical protein
MLDKQSQQSETIMAFDQSFEITSPTALGNLKARLRKFDKNVNIIKVNDEWIQFNLVRRTWMKLEFEIRGELRQVDSNSVWVNGTSRLPTSTVVAVGLYIAIFVVFPNLALLGWMPSFGLWNWWPNLIWLALIVFNAVYILLQKRIVTQRLIDLLDNGEPYVH